MHSACSHFHHGAFSSFERMSTFSNFTGRVELRIFIKEKKVKVQNNKLKLLICERQLKKGFLIWLFYKV